MKDFQDISLDPICSSWDSLLKTTEVASTKLEREHRFKVLLETAGQQKGALPEELKGKINEMGGNELTLVIQKTLFPSEVDKKQCRLSMPLKQLWNPDFLLEKEVQVLLNEGPILLPLILSASMQMLNMALAIKDKKDSGRTYSGYVPQKSWIQVVEALQLEGGDIVQVWSFRVEDKLHMALVKLRF